MPYTRAGRDELESLLDTLGVEGVMSVLAEICHEKELHSLKHWQDRGMASRWRKLGIRLEGLASSLDDPHFQ